MNSNVARALVACVLFTLPAVAIACPVCFDPNETARGAFFSTAIFLTLLPLSMIVGVAWWMARRVRELEAAERAPKGTAASTGA